MNTELSTDASRYAFTAGEPVTLIDNKARRFLAFLAPDKRIHVPGGSIDLAGLIGQQPGARVRTNKGQVLAAYRTTLEEYVLLMPRAATVVPPKDIAYLVHWADVGPGNVVVEAGIGSGGLSLGLLRAVGESGRVIAFELRDDHANRARKNIEAWPEPLLPRLEIRMGDVHEGLKSLRDVDRVVLDLPDPGSALAAASVALKPGGLFVTYVPGIRQIDAFVQAVLDHPDFSEPEVTEVILRPWVADRQRLRPELRITGHTGFLARARRRGPGLPPREIAPPIAEGDEAPSDTGDDAHLDA